MFSTRFILNFCLPGTCIVIRHRRWRRLRQNSSTRPLLTFVNSRRRRRRRLLHTLLLSLLFLLLPTLGPSVFEPHLKPEHKNYSPMRTCADNKTLNRERNLTQ